METQAMWHLRGCGAGVGHGLAGVVLTMRFFGRRSPSRDPLVLAWADQTLAYVQAHLEKNGVFRVQRFGVLRQGTDSPEDFARKLAALGLRGLTARVMLRPAQYQILQIETPAVAPEELRTAARWQIRDMVDRHVDDLTLDVLKVGDDQVRSGAGLFVVTAANAVIREVMQTAQAARLTREVMASACQLSVPLKVDVEIGDNWLEMEPAG